MIKRILLIVLSALLLIIAGFVIYISTAWDKKYELPYPDLTASTDSAVIERGRYLVHGPAHCSSCHVSSIKELVLSDQGANVPLKGGVLFPMGPLGVISPANLTPDETTGIGRYTDGQLFRMMRHAVKPDGTATISLMMPFWNMADDDLVAIVSYLRSMDPVFNEVPAPKWTFMGKAVRVMAPTFKPVYDAEPPDMAPPMEPTVERGEYLARYVTNCVGCHTERDPMTFEATGPEFAGGMEFEPYPELHVELGYDADLWTRSPNITPHPGSALSRFPTVEDWISRFRNGRVIMISPMDWGPFSRMSDQDLEALYLYLHSLAPVAREDGLVMFKKE
ncbi:MAG: cytochrome c [Cyclobacteriaceae bacterium]|nr:cytochrome c [Cyclobacteriaceae bacterium]